MADVDFMNISDLISNITPQVLDNLKRAVEIGRWPNGQVVTQEQRENCLQAIIAYEQFNVPTEERTGYVPPKPSCASHKHDTVDEDQPLKWS